MSELACDGSASAPSDPADVSAAQAAFYDAHAEAYDTLIAAEDHDGALLSTLLSMGRIHDAVVADVGAGTGRFARLLAPYAAHVHLVDRSEAMLDVARRKLGKLTSVPFSIHVSDVRALPLATDSVHLAVAGWVFGHFPHWMGARWADEVDQAVSEMGRVVRPGGMIIVVETLGTGVAKPRQHALLDSYFARLETVHGMARQAIATDYLFGDVESAATTLGAFFGDEMAATVRREGWTRVPEHTAVFSVRV